MCRRHRIRPEPRVRLALTIALHCLLTLHSLPSGYSQQADSIPRWKTNAFATSGFELNGTEGRNNPVRRRLDVPCDGPEIYVRFRIRYAKETLDTPIDDEGEFLVLWLDEVEGGDTSTHSGGIPNIGIHVSGNENRFMVRYASQRERYSAEVVGDTDFLVVARLWKSDAQPSAPFDQLDLWVNPNETDDDRPQASTSSSKSISSVAWMGFSTGAKTELEDRIFVWDIETASTWNEILDLPESVSEPSQPTAPTVQTVDFDSDVFPILKKNCFGCHAGEDADIRLDSQDEVLNFCQVGQAERSELVELVSMGEMPPDDRPPLSDSELQILKTWIDEGLSWNSNRLPPIVPKTNHWSFKPIQRPSLPRVRNADWVRSPVDNFIALEHERAGVVPSREADRSTLSRRMSLDMLGLPPRNDRLSVDELLCDPAYGPRWARHWLDVARWAESNGYQHNRPRPHAWRYRDWVVNAFNQDMPYNAFLTEQIAGDELGPDECFGAPEEAIVATGFLAAARYSGNELDKKIQRNDLLVDIVNTTSSAFLGLTMECAQCHTHKFDPITIRDYYRMQAFFAGGQPGNIALNASDEAIAKSVEARNDIFDRTYQREVKIRRRRGIENPELVIPKTVFAKVSASEKQRFQELERGIKTVPQTWSFYAPTTAPQKQIVLPHDMRWPLRWSELETVKTRLLPRGDVHAVGPSVEPGWPIVFGSTNQIEERPRVALANWMTDERNPLTARIWVNRIWAWHFGKGLVATSSDFGSKGAEPTHPELLDFLASELIGNDWSTNHIHRLILESATYRQSSRQHPRNTELDPDNRLYWRFVPRRLEAEAIRDSMLSVAGQLDERAGGPSEPDEENSTRRSLYLQQQRERLPKQQSLFDGSEGVVSCSRRRVSTNALQPLWLLNSEFTQRVADQLASRAGSVENAIQICFGRQATKRESELLNKHAAKHGLSSACLALINSSEFIYLP